MNESLLSLTVKLARSQGVTECQLVLTQMMEAQMASGSNYEADTQSRWMTDFLSPLSQVTLIAPVDETESGDVRALDTTGW